MARKQSDTGIFCQHGLCDGQALTGRAAAGWAEREERLSRSRKQKPKRYQDGWGMEGPDCEFAEVLAHSQAVVIAASAFLRAVWAILNNYYQLLLLMALHRCGSRGGGGGGQTQSISLYNSNKYLGYMWKHLCARGTETKPFELRM